MENYEFAEVIMSEDCYEDLPRDFDQLVVYLSAGALTRAIRQIRAADPTSPHLDYFELRLSIAREHEDPDHTPLAIKDVIAIMTNELRQDLSIEERQAHIQDTTEFMELNIAMDDAYKYN